MGSAPIVTLGGRGTHSLTGTPRSQGYPSKKHLPFVQGSFQLGLDRTNTRAFLGYHAWETPSHPTSLSGQDSPRSAFPSPPSPVLSGGTAAGPWRAPWAGGARWSPWTRAPSRGQREELPPICGGCGEREFRDPPWPAQPPGLGEPQLPGATDPVPRRPEPPRADGPHHGTGRAPRSAGHSDAPSGSREWDPAWERG